MKRFDIQAYVDEALKRARPVAAAKEGEYTAECPRCERYGSFYLNVESGRFVCWKCDWRGKSIVSLIEVVENLSPAEARAYLFRQSVDMRRKGTIMTLLEKVQALRIHSADGDDEVDLVDVPLPDEFIPCYALDKRGEPRWKLPRYLKERKIKSRTARAWGMGYCVDGQYYNRLVIPIECPAGRAFTARDMSGRSKLKYLNPKAANQRLLIGWNVATFGGDLTLVEGPLDAVSCWQCGVPALALGGKNLNDEQKSQLFQLPADTAINVMLDPEEKMAPFTIARLLSVHFKNIYIVRLPDGIDPGDATPEQMAAAIDSAERWSGDRSAELRAKLAEAAAARKARYQ